MSFINRDTGALFAGQSKYQTVTGLKPDFSSVSSYGDDSYRVLNPVGSIYSTGS